VAERAGGLRRVASIW